MPAVVDVIEGLAAALPRDNVDTDVIIPSRDITSPGRDGLGARLFAPWRFDATGAERPDFVLNREPWRRAVVLVAGANFGCGSSREMAVWALAQWGIRCIVAPSFGAIFRDNCVRNALLPVVLPAAAVADLAAAADNGATLRIDLRSCTVADAPSGRSWHFDFDAGDRETLLSGLDRIAQTWRRRQQIEAFQSADRLRRPWAWAAPRQADGADTDTEPPPPETR